MKINFKKFPIYTSIRKDMVAEQDIVLQLSNSIYMNVPGIAAHTLACKIYESDGETELDDRDVDALLECSAMFTGTFADSVKDFVEKKRKEQA